MKSSQSTKEAKQAIKIKSVTSPISVEGREQVHLSFFKVLREAKLAEKTEAEIKAQVILTQEKAKIEAENNQARRQREAELLDYYLRVKLAYLYLNVRKQELDLQVNARLREAEGIAKLCTEHPKYAEYLIAQANGNKVGQSKLEISQAAPTSRIESPKKQGDQKEQRSQLSITTEKPEDDKSPVTPVLFKAPTPKPTVKPTLIAEEHTVLSTPI